VTLEIRFDANVAEILIKQMDEYCVIMNQETVNLLETLNLSGQWDDSQKAVFNDDVIVISKGLSKAMQMQTEYMKVFQERIRELKG